MLPSRRGLLIGLGGFVLAGPAIVRASSLMPIKLLAEHEFDPILIALVRRTYPNQIAYDILKVQPMYLPDDALAPIFATPRMRVKYA